MVKDIKTEIIENRKISKDFYKMSFNLPNISPKPGQFLSIKSQLPTGTFLRRPFAFSNYDKEVAEIIYQVRGKTTAFYSNLKKGAVLNILSPCGNGFPIENSKKAILVAGGIGVGPMLFCAEFCKNRGIPFTLIAGFKSSDFMPTDGTFPKNSVITTDDGSYGFKGTALDYLKTVLLQNSIIYCCGPTIMMKLISNYATENFTECYLSLEEVMGCSVGACMGCVINLTENRKARVCKDGPVFAGKEIKWS